MLLATFSDTLAKALQTRVKRPTCNEPKLSERLEVQSLDALGNRLYKLHVGPAKPVSRPALVAMVRAASVAVEGHKFSLTFLLTETFLRQSIPPGCGLAVFPVA